MMVEPAVGIIMNGVTGRMGRTQHLVRSVLAIRDAGGFARADGSRVPVVPILVGRRADRLAELAAAHQIDHHTTDLDTALSDPAATVYFDAQVTGARQSAIARAIAAGKHVYTEKPLAESVADGQELAQAAASAGIVHGVVHDKLYLPGLRKLRRLVEAGFFGRILSVRGEFGYWVFEGDQQPAQRPSWNYRAERGGGIVLDMYCHWSYLLENLIGPVQSVTSTAVTHLKHRWDEQGQQYDATADDAAYGIFELAGGVIAQINSSWAVRVYRDELLALQVDGVAGSAVAGLFGCRVQHRATTGRPVWNPDQPTDVDFRGQWQPVPDTEPPVNGFRAQWEQFLSDVDAGRPHRYDFPAGVRGLALAEAALRSSAQGRRIDVGERE